MNRKIIIASNRLPYHLKKQDDGYSLEKSVSGLVSGLEDLINFNQFKWIGWNGVNAEISRKCPELKEELKEKGFEIVELEEKIIKRAYDGFINQELWSIFHGFITYSTFLHDEWLAFVEMNQLFANCILENYNDGDIVYVQDFQLMLVPEMLKKVNKDIKVGYFLHIPFPSPDLFKLIPAYKYLVKSLSQADYIGFHTQKYADNYSSICEEENLNSDNIDVNPIGINFDKLEINKDVVSYIRNTIGTSIILGCERADYIKGIAERLNAFDLLLETYPDIREKVTLIQIAVGSRKGSATYVEVGKEIDILVSDINGRYSTLSWTPIKYITNKLDKEELYNLYSASDICSINSLADGLNLVSFEYVGVESNIKRDLILSEFAGASEILDKAHIVNPRDFRRLADLFYQSLTNNSNNVYSLKEDIKKYTTQNWTNKFIEKIIYE